MIPFWTLLWMMLLLMGTTAWAGDDKTSEVPLPIPTPEVSGIPEVPDIIDAKLRDPFQMPEIKLDKLLQKGELEAHLVTDFKLIGVLTGMERLRALVQAPSGKTYVVGERMKLGIQGGVIRRITHDTVYVREKFMNVVGQEETTEIELRLPSELKFGDDEQEKKEAVGSGSQDIATRLRRGE